ncbi:MAG: trigger factor [Clostridiales bacterium]|nr:trigger factor [Clostridiales bacterium]MCF8022261.1 trigger factor [Clostridiales bacterium]
MKATAERIEKNTVELEVEVDVEAFEEGVEKACKKLIKKVNIPGFRRGKAPRRVLENYVGKSAIHNEAVEEVIPNAYMEALEETGVEPVAQPEVELLQVEEGEPLKFKATVKVKPEPKLGQYEGIEMTKVPAEVADEDIQKELENLRDKHAQLVNLEEGSVQQGDVANIDFTGRINGEAFEGGSAEDYSLEVGSGTFIPGFEEQIEGMLVGETKEVSVTFPDDYSNQEFAGKGADFTVIVKSIKRKELAPLDDEFAKDVSEFDTLEELKEDLLNSLKQSAEAKAKEKMQSDLISKVVDNCEADVPEEMVDSKVEEMVKDMERRLMSQGLSMDNYLKYTNSTMDDMKQNLRPEAEKSEKTSLVLDAIAKEQKIEVTDDDVEEKIKEMSQQYQQEPDVIRKIIEGQNQLDTFKESVCREKAVEYLMSKANIIEGTTETE